jgi:hypothetical protein
MPTLAKANLQPIVKDFTEGGGPLLCHLGVAAAARVVRKTRTMTKTTSNAI